MVSAHSATGGVRPRRTLNILACLWLFTILPTAVSHASYWSLISPEGVAVHDYISAGIGDVFCTDDGLTIGFAEDWQNYTYGHLPARAVLEWGGDTLMVALGDSSWSDGVYRFVESTGQFENLEWFIYPRFLVHANGAFYLGGDQGLLISQDGVTWNQVEFFQFQRCVAMASWGEHLAVAVMGNVPGVYYSSDGGENWSAPAAGAPLVEALAFGPDQVLYGVYPGDSRSSGLWQSADFGATWDVSVYSLRMTSDYLAGGHIILGWEAEATVDTGVQLWNEGAEELIPMTGNLPQVTVERFSENTMIDCINVVACTDSGAYMTCDFPDVSVDEGDPIPFVFELTVHPNPFNQEATVALALPLELPVRLRVYDVLGRERNALAHGTMPAGMHTWSIDASGWTSGVYFLRADVGNQTRVQKLLLLR